MEEKLVEHVGKFLLELGQGFAFVGQQVRLELAVLARDGDKPTIGLLLCKNKKEVVAEYALRGFKAPIGVAEWTSAINSSLPAEFVSALPSVEVLEAELAAGEDGFRSRVDGNGAGES